ncbi:hypothetical protein JL720_4773 [Aureococcus anophagefferens]|nr:hypothetical protein JL720_4773 [Aureococcus anophagefferens]
MASYLCLYDFEAGAPAELTFKKGDTLTLVEKKTESWWKCRDGTARVGMVPSPYLREAEPEVLEERPSLTRGSSRRSLSLQVSSLALGDARRVVAAAPGDDARRSSSGSALLAAPALAPLALAFVTGGRVSGEFEMEEGPRRGIALEDLEPGSGRTSAPGDAVAARCAASAWDGGSSAATPFASTAWDGETALTLVLGAGRVCAGLEAALAGLKPGGSRRDGGPAVEGGRIDAFDIGRSRVELLPTVHE